jgi:SWI/SNF-related matrix-associated actin-dependent regulator of chromatin subfamily A member 5
LDALDEKEEKWLESSANPRRSRKSDRFTDKDKLARKQLLTQGFAAWSKKDFMNFIKGCESHGRNETELITENIGTKTAEEVQTYAAYFWEHYTELPNGKELIERIEQGESNIVRVRAIQTTLDRVFESMSSETL